MRVLVIGAGHLGIHVIKQLRKSQEIEIVVADPHENPEALKQGIIQKIDIMTHVTALNFDDVISSVRPDLVLLARTLQDWEKADTPMGTQFVVGMERELTKSDVPVLPISEDIL